MEKTIQASICGISFQIESDAYEMLETYLNRLERVYGPRGTEGKEIIGDIEARIAELILSRQSDIAEPVTLSCIADIIGQLGDPTETEREDAGAAPVFEARIQKRLYRNMDGAHIGGVLNGLASYFNIEVGILRSFALLLLVFSGFLLVKGGDFEGSVIFVVLAYLFAWLIIPKAVTPRQKLEMTGEKITVSSIEDSFLREIDMKSNHPKNKKSASIFANVVYAVCRLVRFILLLLDSMIAVSLSAVVLFLLIACFYALAYTQPLVSVFTSSDPAWIISLFSASVLVPVTFVLLLFVKMIFRFRIHWLVYTLFVAGWICLWAGSGTIVAREMIDNGAGATIVEKVTVQPAGDTLFVKRWDRPYKAVDYRFDDVLFSPDKDYLLVRNRIWLVSPKKEETTEDFMMEYRHSCRGSSQMVAERGARKIELGYKMEGDTLFVDPYFQVTAQDRFHFQEGTLYLQCPPRRKLLVSEDLLRLVPHLHVQGEYNDEGYFVFSGDE